MGKDKKILNPADAFRKEQRKKELQKTKKDRVVKKEVRTLLNDPRKIDEEIERVQKLSEENLLDKALKDRIKELKMMKSVALKKQIIDVNIGRIKPQQEEISSSITQSKPHFNAQQSRVPQFAEKIPENSIYYHPVYNPTGAPPVGKEPK